MVLTATQTKIIENLKRGRSWNYGVQGMSQAGGWSQSVASLIVRGLVELHPRGGYRLTPAGETLFPAKN